MCHPQKQYSLSILLTIAASPHLAMLAKLTNRNQPTNTSSMQCVWMDQLATNCLIMSA